MDTSMSKVACSSNEDIESSSIPMSKADTFMAASLDVIMNENKLLRSYLVASPITKNLSWQILNHMEETVNRFEEHFIVHQVRFTRTCRKMEQRIQELEQKHQNP